MIEKGQLIFFVYPCDSLSGVSKGGKTKCDKLSYST